MSRGLPLDPWTWTTERKRAAELVADGHLTHDQIAAECCIDPSNLHHWKRAPEFRTRVHEHLTAWRAKLSQEGLALKSNRIAMLMGRAATIRGVIRARGKLPSHAANAPGTTIAQKGIQTRTIKSIGSGPFLEKFEEFAVDTVLLSEERGYLQHIATELGEWKQVLTVTGTLATAPTPVAIALAESFTSQEMAVAKERRRLKREAAESAR